MSVVTWKGCETHKDGRCSQDEHPEAYEVAYVGAVLATRERNFHDDSDFYAVVWDETEGCIKTVEYATTRGWTYNNHAHEDATPAVNAKARAWLAEQAFRVLAAKLKRDAAVPAVDKRVRVVAGRKVPVGTEARVFWTGRQRAYKYRHYTRDEAWMYEDRVGLAFTGPDGKPREAFVLAEQVSVLDPAQYEPTAEQLAAVRERVVRGAASSDPGITYAGWVAAPGLMVM